MVLRALNLNKYKIRWLRFVPQLHLWFIRGVGLIPQTASDSTSLQLHTPPAVPHVGRPVLILEWTGALPLLCRQFDQGRPIEPYRGSFDEPVASRPYGVRLLSPVASAPRDLCRAADAAAMPASLSRLCLVIETGVLKEGSPAA